MGVNFSACESNSSACAIPDSAPVNPPKMSTSPPGRVVALCTARVICIDAVARSSPTLRVGFAKVVVGATNGPIVAPKPIAKAPAIIHCDRPSIKTSPPASPSALSAQVRLTRYHRANNPPVTAQPHPVTAPGEKIVAVNPTT